MSIDAFLQDLFGPGAGTAAPPPPATFDDRFAPAVEQPLKSPYENQPQYDEQYDDQIPANATPTSGTFGGAPSPGTPMPTARPPIEALLAGPRHRPPEAGPGANMLPPGGDGMPPAPGGGAGGDLMSRLAGLLPRGGGAPAPAGAEPGIMDKLTGKKAQSIIQGGFAGGNPNFKGGAFMKGASGGLGGGLASDKEDEAKAIAAADKTQKQGNFDRTQTDKEATSEALRKLYGQRGQALTTSADARASGTGKGAWNKPPHERYKDAMHLIQAERKAIYGQINPLSPKADQAAAKADADARLKAFTDKTLRTYGIDENGQETAPTQGGAGGAVSPAEGKNSGMYDTDAISGAREAIARGANPDQVKQRLKENGIAFADEDLAL